MTELTCTKPRTTSSCQTMISTKNSLPSNKCPKELRTKSSLKRTLSKSKKLHLINPVRSLWSKSLAMKTSCEGEEVAKHLLRCTRANKLSHSSSRLARLSTPRKTRAPAATTTKMSKCRRRYIRRVNLTRPNMCHSKLNSICKWQNKRSQKLLPKLIKTSRRKRTRAAKELAKPLRTLALPAKATWLK